jgi:pseudouridine synthase
MKTRLNRFLAQCGLGSRRAVERLILEGSVTVNGVVTRALATRVDPNADRVAVAGRPAQPAEKLVCLVLNKPRGYDVTRGDPHSRRRVYDLLPPGTHPSVKAVGRLDRDSTGLLLLTNDGELAHRLTHPRYGCPKTYQVQVAGEVALATLVLLTEGVQLDDGPARAVSAERLTAGPQGSTLRIVMHEGRKRIVRRLCETVGHPVTALERTAIGSLELGNLRRGQIRALTPNETAGLRRGVGLESPPPAARHLAS